MEEVVWLVGRSMGFRDQSLGSSPSHESSSQNHSFFISQDGMKTASMSGCCEGYMKP